MSNSKPPGRFWSWFKFVWRSRVVFFSSVTVGLLFVWLIWSQDIGWHAKRELYACWGRELTPRPSDQVHESTLHHEETMRVIRKDRGILIPFLASSLEPRDDSTLERLAQLLNRIPFVKWQPEARPDWAGMALGCLLDLGPEAKPVVSDLERMLHRPKASFNAAQALVAIGPEALPCFERAFASASPEIRLAILEGLTGCEEPWRADALPLVLRAIDDPDQRVQRSAAALTGLFPEVRAKVLVRLANFLNESTDASGAVGPAFGLALLGEEATEPLFVAAVGHTNRQIRHAALGGLALVDEMGRNQAPARDRPTFNGWRCMMNARMLRTAFEFYSGKEEQARHELLQRLTQHPAARVHEQAAAALARTSGQLPKELPPSRTSSGVTATDQ